MLYILYCQYVFFPAILTVSYSIFKTLKEEFNFDFKSFQYFAGHSLGEYSALVCSGSLNFDDAIYLLNERGKAMQSAVPVGAGSMLAVLGLETKEVKKFIEEQKEKNGVCEVANDNATGQVIISGDKKCVNYIQDKFKEKKIKIDRSVLRHLIVKYKKLDMENEFFKKEKLNK